MDDVGIDKVIESNKVSFKKVIKTSLAIKWWKSYTIMEYVSTRECVQEILMELSMFFIGDGEL